MGDQLANNPEALRLFFTEDIYLVQQDANMQAETPLTVSTHLQEEVAESIASVQEEASSYNLQVAQPAPEGADQLPQAVNSRIKPETSFVYRGKNARNILILVYDEVNEVTTEAGREVFKNIVKAKNLSANDYAIVNYASYKNSSFHELRRFFNAKAILTFGVNAVQIGIDDYPQHAVVSHEGVQLMFSADLHQLSMDLSIKRALWTALKEMEL